MSFQLICNRFTPYTAISHVWADGLGNTISNALPKCRLVELQDMMDHVPIQLRVSSYGPFERLLAARKHWFWLDSLCIPAAPMDDSAQSREDFNRTKTMAINFMNVIYTHALPTLVIDSEMRTLSKYTHTATLMAYASHCGWTTRGWTLQEGSLSRRIVFALSDGIFEVKRSADIGSGFTAPTPGKLKRLKTSIFNPGNWISKPSLPEVKPEIQRHPTASFNVKDILMLDWSRHRICIQTLGRREDWEPKALPVAWNSLIHRHTSHPKDLFVVLANILGYRASDMLKSEQPLSVLFGSLKRIPIAYLFNVKPNTSQDLHLTTLEIDMNRWVPREMDFAISAGPSFYTSEGNLSLYRKDKGPGCTIFIARGVEHLPRKFLLRSAGSAEEPITVEALWDAGDLQNLRLIEAGAVGMCFLFEGENTRLQSSSFKGAALAIVREHEKKMDTMFYCSLLALTTADNRDSYLPTIDASYTGPDTIYMRYSKCG